MLCFFSIVGSSWILNSRSSSLVVMIIIFNAFKYFQNSYWESWRFCFSYYLNFTLYIISITSVFHVELVFIFLFIGRVTQTTCPNLCGQTWCPNFIQLYAQQERLSTNVLTCQVFPVRTCLWKFGGDSQVIRNSRDYFVPAKSPVKRSHFADRSCCTQKGKELCGE